MKILGSRAAFRDPKGRANVEIKAKKKKKDIKGYVAIVTKHGSSVCLERKHVTQWLVGSKF